MKKVVLLFILFVFSLSRADAQEFHFIPRIGLEFGKYLSRKFCGHASGVKYWCGGGNTF